MEYFLNGMAFTFGTATALFVVGLVIELQDKIERNKRFGRKWWKI